MSQTAPLPPGACDCHMHVFEDRLPLAPTATFKPPHAPAADYRGAARARPEPGRRAADRLRLRQPLHARGARRARAAARAVVVVAPDERGRAGAPRTPRRARRPLHDAAGGVLAGTALAPTAARIAPLGWHVDLQLDGRELPLHEARCSRCRAGW
jgi:D-galactarolactone isomerase